MLTYNHEHYIAQAIESVLMQERDFPIELVIGEDCSTDRTREICQEYQLKYPDVIRLLKNEINIGMMSNFIQVLKECKGSYIALCEGDDYWTDLQKLKKQVNAMKNNTTLCFHEIYNLNQETGEKSTHCDSLTKDFYDIRDVIKTNFIPTCSVMFRRVENELLDSLLKFKIGDWPLYNILLKNGGKAVFLKDNMAVYRMHRAGVFSHKAFIERLLIIRGVIKELKKTINKFTKEYNCALIQVDYSISIEYLKMNQHESIKKYFLESILIWGGREGLNFQAKIILLFFFPKVFKFFKKNIL